MHETNIITRTIVSKFRLSDHRLEIEIGRYFRPPKKPEERICTFCNTMEDEIHCLMTCNLNSEERKELFDVISSTKPVFNCLDTKSKFIYLMNETNTPLNHAINKFIENCLKSSYGAKQTYEPANTYHDSILIMTILSPNAAFRCSFFFCIVVNDILFCFYLSIAVLSIHLKPCTRLLIGNEI